MIDAIHPRWLAGGALLALVLGVAGLYAEWWRWAPMALFAAELLAILAVIVWTTPSLQQSQRAAATDATSDVLPSPRTTSKEHRPGETL
jgi:O-antigen ligase